MKYTPQRGLLKDIRTVTITSKGQIAIPRSMRRMRGFGEGSQVAVLAYEDRIELRPAAQVGAAIENALASERALARDWESPEDEAAWKDL